MTVVDDVTTCITSPVTVSIPDIPDIPNIFTSVTNDSFCVNGDGQIAVTSSSNGAEPASYTYEIFDGFNTTIANRISIETIANGSTGFTFTGLEDGNYRIRVTNDDLTCNSFVDAVVTDISTIPTFTTSHTINDNSSCDPLNPNGFLSVSIQGDAVSNYRFTWYAGANSSGAIVAGPTVGDNDLDGRAAGDYTVVAENITTGCETVELTLNIANDPYIPNIIITEDAPQTDCGTGNGRLSAFIDNDPGLPSGTQTITGFSFQWQLDGVDLVDGVPAANGSVPVDAQTAVVDGLIADEYTVVVTHDNTGCTATQNFVLTSNQVIPILSLDNTQPNTSCDPASYTGEIHVTVSPAGTYDFDYFYSDGTQVTDIAPVSGSSSADITGLVDDTYRVVASSDLLCSSDTLTVIVNSSLITPAFQVRGADTNDNTVCDIAIAGDFNGQITVEATDGSAEADYSYAWFVGASTDAADDLLTNIATASISATGDVASELPGGTYTVVITDVTNTGNNCTTTIQHTINDNTSATFLAHVPTATPDDVNVCPGGTGYPDGGVTVDAAAVTAAGGSGSYTFRYYIGNSTSGTLIVDAANIGVQKGGANNGINVSGASTATVAGLDPGDYTVEVVDNNTGCITQPVTVTVLDNPDNPAFQVRGADTNDNTVCDIAIAGDFNGQITVEATDGSAEADYSYAWFVGASTDAADDLLTNIATASISATGDVASELPGGTYTVVITDVTNTGNNCTTTIQHTINDNTSATFLAHVPTATPDDVNVCPGGNKPIARHRYSTSSGPALSRQAPKPRPAGLVAPELQITDSSSVIGYANFMEDMVQRSSENTGSQPCPHPRLQHRDCTRR